MQSVRLQEALAEFASDAATMLQAEVVGGAEVPFELAARSGRRGSAGPALYCYRPLTGEFIAERAPALEHLPSHSEAVRLLGRYDGLERYLTGSGLDPAAGSAATRARTAMRALLRDVFAEQSDFELNPERLHAALARLEQAAHADASGVTVVATIHGVAIGTPELALTKGLVLARPEALGGLPEGALAVGPGGTAEHLIAVLSVEEEQPTKALAHAGEVLRDLLRALRLFGDGRVALGTLAWTRVGDGGWNPIALGAGGHPRGMLIVTAEQEDELRAFCNLVSRRAPHGDELAWALRRFELGCERDGPYEALSDHLLALRALLEPEGPASGMLPGRLAALCATPGRRLALTERVVQAIALEQAVIAGTAVEHAATEALASDMADHLRALLRDVICGHLDPDLAALANEILLEPQDDPPAGSPKDADALEQRPLSVEQMLGYPGEPQEVLDLSV